MPKVAMDYKNTIIYKIVCNDLTITECYVGHTTNFTKRKCRHKYNCNSITNKEYNFYIYQFIRNNGGWDNWSMIEIEKYPCNDRNEAGARERYWFEELNATLNKYVPSRSREEYLQQNADILKDYRKNYREQNADKIKIYRQQNADKIKIYNKTYREQRKNDCNK